MCLIYKGILSLRASLGLSEARLLTVTKGLNRLGMIIMLSVARCYLKYIIHPINVHLYEAIYEVRESLYYKSIA